MATGTYSPDPFGQYCDDNGNPLSSGTLTTYAAGTSTPVTTYSDVNLTVANTNPISLDAAGRPTSGAIFLTPGVSYKFILKDVLGATVATRDNIAAVPLNPNVNGTWTPTLGGSISQTGQTYVFQVGTYVKLGTLIIASYSIQLSAKGTITGFLQIKNFPFPAAGSLTYANSIDIWVNTNTAFVGMAIELTVPSSDAFVTGIAVAGPTNNLALSSVDITDTFIAVGSLIYTTTS